MPLATTISLYSNVLVRRVNGKTTKWQYKAYRVSLLGVTNAIPGQSSVIRSGRFTNP
jgi:hypothetical protein